MVVRARLNWNKNNEVDKLTKLECPYTVNIGVWYITTTHNFEWITNEFQSWFFNTRNASLVGGFQSKTDNVTGFS